jgi:hypothetical protein
MQSKRGGTTASKKTKKKKKVTRTPDINGLPIIRDGYSTSTTARQQLAQ